MVRLTLALGFLFGLSAIALADQVIMKDGTVYKGKIVIDTDKVVVIGNPPFDPTSYYLETQDIEKIVYEEYKLVPPAQRKRGLTVDTSIGGRFYSSDTVSPAPALSLYGGLGFRVHPLLEFSGGLQWMPALSDSDALEVSNEDTTRRYEKFWMYSGVFNIRLYPFFKKPWKTEPYVTGGYHVSKLIPKASGDSLKGSGWTTGIGALYPLATHFFLDARLSYGQSVFGTISFLGQKGSLSPDVEQSHFDLAVGLSWRL